MLFHPWLFSGAVKKTEGQVAEGDIVEIYSSDNRYLATGHFHEGSIKARIFSFTETTADFSFWKTKLEAAHSLRQRLGLTDNQHTTVYRLVHAEGDGLPGLVIDIYGDAAVIQTHTRGMNKLVPVFSDALREIFKGKLSTIYDKSSDALGKQAIASNPNHFLLGDKPEGIVKENGISFFVNWVEGQKTGFFIDQRENRDLLRRYVTGKNVLNTFSYSGGFSMYALTAPANLVHSVDSSKKAADWALHNAELNTVTSRHSFFTEDVFDFLKKSDQFYDVIILDPPAFAKHLSSADKATIGYRNLNAEGFRRIAPGGILFTFSCSQVIDKMLFRKIVFQAAAQS
ncbi:MAG TPA: class I SAM-dependent rRNA methyltransferase, partial [Bacteroidia bacterium]|nr:class I SAM-dependent rRNA methyltransferase [Bacteroidia bacterium]